MTQTAEKFFLSLSLTNLQRIFFYGMLFSICLFRLGRVLVGGSALLAPVKWFFAFALLLWIANLLLSRDGATIMRLLRDEANALFVVFLGISLLSIVGARYHGEINASEIFERIKVYSSFLMVIGIVNNRKVLRMAVLLLILGSIITTGVGLYELVTGNAFFRFTHRMGVAATHANVGLSQEGGGRVQGLVSDAGLHGYVVVVFMGLVLPWVFYARRRFVKALAVFFLICLLANLIGTGTRSSWLAWAVAFIVFVLFLKHRYKLAIIFTCAGAGILVFLFMALFPHIPTFERLDLSKSVSWGWRLDAYYEALLMMKEHPILGIGTGNYLYEYHNYLSERPALSRYFYGWLHNSYLQIWTENGTLGLAVFVGLLLCIWLGLLKHYMATDDRELQGLGLGLMLAMTGHMVSYFAMPILYQEIGGLLMGLCVAYAHVARAEEQASSLTADGESGYLPRHGPEALVT